MNSKKILIYARVSTKNQDTVSQLLKLQEYCKNHNYEIVKIFEDTGSWKNDKRVNYQKLLNEIHLKSFDILLVWKLDRLSRSLKDLIDLWDLLNNKWIHLVTYDNAIDTTTPWWKLLFQMLGVFAEFQRWIIIDNIKSWIQNAKAKWIHCWRKNTTDKIYNSQLLNEALSLKSQWLSYRKVAINLNIKDYSTLSKRMKQHQKKINNKEIIENSNIYDFIK